MEVFVRNVPVQTGEHDLRNFLRPKLNSLAIRAFHCYTARSKDFAKITFRTTTDGEKFLRKFGERRPNNRQRIPRATPAKLIYHSTPIYCEQSRSAADPYLLRCLEKEEKERVENSYLNHGPPIANTSFECSTIMCGNWNYVGENLVFMPELILKSRTIVHFKERAMILVLDNGSRMVIRYDTIELLTTDAGHYPGITATLHQSPHFFNSPPKNDLLEMINMFGNVNLRNGSRPHPKRSRVAGFGDKHKEIAGSSLVYRCTFKETNGFSSDVEQKLETLKNARGIPPMIYHSASIIRPRESHIIGLRKLHEALESFNNELPFPLTFQVQKLAQNGYLSPHQIIDLLPAFTSMFERTTLPICVTTMRRLFLQIPYPGPNVKAEDFDKNAIIELLLDIEKASTQEAQYAEGFGGTASQNTALIHRVTITPAGMYLDGPESESNNRILRKYAGSHSNFVRVTFCDEDGGRIQYASNVSNDEVFDGVFKNVLQKGFPIGKQKYEYLGSSHSSLRTQSCWFVAPFIQNNVVYDAQRIINDLGRFEHIRSPAKCAARIGQAFSDTPNTLTLDETVTIETIADIERNGRVFSDGVGTVSELLMHKIWDKLPNKHRVKPTCFQIRYRGAKGMISLDSRLPGVQLRLRKSMIKFEGSSSNDLEICGGAYKPLPMYLNRQFIKILEDLGVEPEYFMRLQAKEISRLRAITANAYNASTFLQSKRVGDVVLLPYLIDHCSALDLDFRNDLFLRDVLEMTVLIELRTLKHKARIPVEKGYHLHGIMDETGILEEGEIYCCWLEDGKRTTLVGSNVVITRAPALHPGDVQWANAVDVPANSPLKRLYNCVCFSQKGPRDLPSQLSGGDLDGDLYYVMFDPDMKLKRTVTPADYPRLPPLDIDRPVTQQDMADFFLTFMKTDQLGVLSNRHQVYADQDVMGTECSNCLKLAELCSTAVDYSKTGIPPELGHPSVPKNALWRPDFMAPGPHIKISHRPDDRLEFVKEYVPIEAMDEEDEITNIKYYESKKVCGRLYRAIDERKVFEDIQKLNVQANDSPDVMQHMWEFVKSRSQGIQWQHLREIALEIQEIYENNMLDTMHQYSEHPTRPISEREVFVGNILGKVGSVSKKQRELCTSMKEKYDENAAFIVNCIIKVNDEYSDEALERSIACFAVSLDDRKRKGARDEPLKSFRYLAAGVCLREMERVPGLLPNSWQG
ncbi:hypothetical protein BHYA_0063g00010 [Botrytis hyacinthi]|uniref:RNA-dependent RNA polymerase n=1 Tax=Botrytis hyacinthi TaxID=278943 RepID=A0A4Z1GPW7_9HELO|nr:hypothetical protein BHYA_0063g00010 [Botrytis hyacinthi]